jgi:hypothetical protein
MDERGAIELLQVDRATEVDESRIHQFLTFAGAGHTIFLPAA